MENKQKLFYLSHMLKTKGDFNKNIERLNRIADHLHMEGYLIINPATVIGHTGLNDEQHRGKIMDICLSLVTQCDVVVVCSNISMGVAKEIAFAQAYSIPVIMLEQLSRGFARDINFVDNCATTDGLYC